MCMLRLVCFDPVEEFFLGDADERPDVFLDAYFQERRAVWFVEPPVKSHVADAEIVGGIFDGKIFRSA